MNSLVNSNPVLSAGSLKRIVESEANGQCGECSDRPIVQILGSKQVMNGSVRLILYDGSHTLKTAMAKSSPQIDHQFQSQQLDMFSVVRLDKYWVSSCGANDVNVLIVSDITLITRGSQIKRKLDSMDSPDMSASAGTAVHSSTNANQLVAINMNNNNNTYINPNYRPPSAPNAVCPAQPIDVSKVCPIAAITPFFNAFVIRVRITSKTPIRSYTTRNGTEGKVFSFDATDESSEIRITAFNTDCDKYYDLIEKDMIYYISKGNVKTANKRYSNLKSDYEITLSHDSAIELCSDTTIPVPKIQFKFTPIAQLVQQSAGSSVDVCGVIRAVEELKTIIAKKNQKEYQKRDVLLVDKTLAEVRLTLWDTEAQAFSGTEGQVLAVKNAVVGEFRGKTLSCVQSSVLELDPDLPHAHILKGWYDRECSASGLKNVIQLSKGSDANTTSAEHKYLCQITERSIGDGQTLYYNCKATILNTNRTDKHLYKSCGLKGCMKKVREENGFYFCDKCGHNATQFQWRLMLSVCCADTTAEVWLTAFQEVAEKIVGKSVTELTQMYESDPNQYQSLIAGLNFKSFVFRIGSKVEEYNNEKRVKSTCFAVIPIEPIQRSKKLLNDLKMWSK